MHDYLKYLKVTSSEVQDQPIQPPSKSIKTKRIHPRINCYLDCDIKVVIPETKRILSLGRIKNISTGGALIRGYEQDPLFSCIGNDDPVYIEFKLDGKYQYIEKIGIEGRVTRATKGELAVKFKDISPGARNNIAGYVG